MSGERRKLHTTGFVPVETGTREIKETAEYYDESGKLVGRCTYIRPGYTGKELEQAAKPFEMWWARLVAEGHIKIKA